MMDFSTTSQPGTSSVAAAADQTPNLLYCKSCKVSVSSNAEWLGHLIGESHQLPKRLIGNGMTMGMSEWDPKRTLSITAVAGIPAKKIADALNFWGSVEDISYLAKKDGGTHGCHFLMRTQESVMSITRTTQPIKIGTRTLVVKQYLPPLKLIHGKALSTATLANWERNIHRSGGIQANGKFFCKGCSETIFPLAGWITHLTSDAHQARHKECRFVRKIFWDMERTVRIGDLSNILPHEVLNYLLDFGPIEDFFYITTKKQAVAPLCYCLFSCLASVERITENPKHKAYTRAGNNLSLTVTPVHTDLKLRYKKMADLYGVQKRRGASADALLGTLKEEFGASADLEEEAYTPEGIMIQGKVIGGGATYRNNPLEKLAVDPPRQRKHAFDCVTCNEEFRHTEDWWEHLASQAHRRLKSTQYGGGLKYFNHTETVLLRGLIGVERMDILRFAGSWGTVQDFLYQSEKDGTAENCYVRFESAEAVDKLLSCSGFLVIGSTKIVATAVPEYAGWSKKQRKALMAEKRALEVAAEVKAKLKVKSFMEERSDVLQLLEGKELSQQIEDLVQYTSWDSSFWEQCKEVVEEDIPFVLKKATSPLSKKKFRLVPFGQYVTGVTMAKNHTVHLLLDTKVENVQEIVLVLHELRKILEKCKPSANFCPAQLTVDSIQNPEESSVNFGSELHFKNLAMKNDFVIRLGNWHAVQESALIDFYTKLDPRIKPVLTIIAYQNELFKLLKLTPKEEAFPHQIINFLVLFFLIHQKIVPTVDHLYLKGSISAAGMQKQEADPLPVEGYSVSFCKDLNVVKPNTAVLEMLSDPSIRAHSCLGLLKDVLQFYTSVDLQKFVLCLRFGSLVPKVDFLPENVGQLPGELGRLYRFSSDGVHRSKFLSVTSPLVLQDPFVLHLNLTPNKGNKVINRFVSFCRGAVIRLENEMAEETPNLGALFRTGRLYEQNQNGDGEREVMPFDDSRGDLDEFSSSAPKKIKLDSEASQQETKSVNVEDSLPATCTPESVTSGSREAKDNPEGVTTIKEEVKQEPDVVEISDQEDDGWDRPESPSIFEIQDQYEDVDDYEDSIRNNVDVTLPEKDLEGVEDFDDDISVISAEDEGVGTNDVGSVASIEDKIAEMTLNRSLQVYFKRNFNGGSDDMKINKLQALLLQYVIEFNSVFWPRCFNLTIEMKESYANWTLPPFAKVDGVEGCHTLEERLASVDLSLNKVDVKFTVKSTQPQVHSFLENTNVELISWKALNAGGKQDSTLGNLTKLLIADHEESAAKLRASLFVASTSQNYLEIDGSLKAAIATIPSPKISLGRCILVAAMPQMGTRKVALLTKMWKKLEAKYCDRMVKRWLSSCKDFDKSKADNFQVSVAQGYQRKANKNQKNLMKYLNKRTTAMEGRMNNYGGSAQKNPNLTPIGPRKGILKKPAQSFTTQPPTSSWNNRSVSTNQSNSYYNNMNVEPIPLVSPRPPSWRASGKPGRGSVHPSHRFPGVSSSSRYPTPRSSFQTPRAQYGSSYSTGFTGDSFAEQGLFNSMQMQQYQYQYQPRIPPTPRMPYQFDFNQSNPQSFSQPQRHQNAYRPPELDSDRVPIYRRP